MATELQHDVSAAQQRFEQSLHRIVGRFAGEERQARQALELAVEDVERVRVQALIDRKLLTTVIERFGGGPVGLNALASSIGEDRGTIEDLYEPYLIQIGFLNRWLPDLVRRRLRRQIEAL